MPDLSERDKQLITSWLRSTKPLRDESVAKCTAWLQEVCMGENHGPMCSHPMRGIVRNRAVKSPDEPFRASHPRQPVQLQANQSDEPEPFRASRPRNPPTPFEQILGASACASCHGRCAATCAFLAQFLAPSSVGGCGCGSSQKCAFSTFTTQHGGYGGCDGAGGA